MNYGEIQEVTRIFESLSCMKDIPVAIKIFTYKNLKELRRENKVIFNINNSLIEKYTLKDENNKRMTCVYMNTSIWDFGENKEKYDNELNELLNTNVDITINMIGINELLEFISVNDCMILTKCNFIKEND